MPGEHLRNHRRRIDRRLVIVVVVALVAGLVLGVVVGWLTAEDESEASFGPVYREPVAMVATVVVPYGQRAVQPPSTAMVWPVM